MSTKNSVNSPKPENVLNALHQAAQPLTMKELADQTNVLARNLLNPIIKKLIDEGKISTVGENPPKFALAEGSEFTLKGSQATATKAKPKPTSNVHPISPKNARQEKAAAPAVKADSNKKPDQGQLNIRDAVIQLIAETPQQITDLENLHANSEELKQALKSLHDEGLVIQEKIMGADTIWLSPRGEEAFAKLQEDGKLSVSMPAAAAAAAEPASQAPAVAPIKADEDATPTGVVTAKRGPGRPKGSTSKNKASAKNASGTTPASTEQPKSATPKGATAAPRMPAVEPTAAPAAPVANAASEMGLPANIGEQLMGLLKIAAKSAVEAESQAKTERETRNAMVAEDMAAISALMLDLGNRLKSLSENMMTE